MYVGLYSHTWRARSLSSRLIKVLRFWAKGFAPGNYLDAVGILLPGF